MGGILAVAARAPQGGRVRKPAAAQQTDPATANQGTCSSTHARLAVATGRNSCPFYDSSELLLSSITSASRAEREAIGAVIRSSGKVTALVDRGLGFSAPRLSTLRLLRHLSSSAYDAAGADATRRALVSAGALETAASLVFLSPTARSGGVADGHTIRQIVYCALALIANLQAAPSCWEPSGCRLAVPSEIARLEELASSEEPRHQCGWAGAAIAAAAQRCLRNLARVRGGALPACVEQAPLDEPALGAYSEPQPAQPPRRPPTYARPAPSRTSGFHDFYAPLSLSELPLVPHRHEEGGERLCTVCLEEFVPGEELRVLPCLHRFHDGCISGWAQAQAVAGRHRRGCRCPNCNQPMFSGASEE